MKEYKINHIEHEINTHHVVKELIRDSKLDKLDTKLLLRHILGYTQAQLIINNNYQLTEEEYQSYIGLYNKCLSGFPISYILGYKEFYSYIFKVTPDTLIPRPETELLVDKVLALAKSGDRVLDLGTGSGCIAISCKLENQALDITASDKFRETLDVAISNAKRHNVDINFIQSNWFENIDKMYNVIVSNPPYIEANDIHLNDLKFEPQMALTDLADGLTCIKHIIANAKKYLKQNGYLLIEHGYNQGESVRELMLDSGYKEIETIKDYSQIERITLGRICDEY